jgi:hypothetical protein
MTSTGIRFLALLVKQQPLDRVQQQTKPQSAPTSDQAEPPAEHEAEEGRNSDR